jgi:hypothetical protein
MNTHLENKIINLVIEKYVNSYDFNGFPMKNLIEEIQINEKILIQEIRRLIEEEKLSISLYGNPHIKAFDYPIEDQINFLENRSLEEIVLYPTRLVLKGRVDEEKYKDKPFSRMLLEGYPQFHQCYFELAVLERYKNDPRYYLYDDGTNLDLWIKDKFYLDYNTPEEDKIIIQNFGYAYSRDTGEKIIMVFLRYLHDLSAKHQKYWESYLVKGDFLIDKDYFERSFLAKFTDFYSIYDAFLEEEKQINIISKIIGKPPLFLNEYDYVPDFSNLPLPTKAYFQNFIHVLDKLISENINREFFKGDIDFKNEKEEILGSLKLLENWLRKYFKPYDPKPFENMINIFRKIRNQRQKPAHKIEENEFNNKYLEMQKKLMKEAYIAIRTLRLILCNHPRVKNSDYQPPEWLQDGKIKF